MANQRYFLFCPQCKTARYLGQSTGGEVHGHAYDSAQTGDRTLDFVTEHRECYPRSEWQEGNLFSIITESAEEIADAKLDKSHRTNIENAVAPPENIEQKMMQMAAPNN